MSDPTSETPSEQVTSYDLDELRSKHAENERRSTDFLAEKFLSPLDRWLQMLLDCHAFAIDRRLRGEHSELMEAYASISSVAYSNAELARTALVRGFYGNVAALLRPLSMANDLVIDITANAPAAKNWISLRSFKPGEKTEESKRLRKFFKDGNLRKRVKESGEYSPSSDLYSILSDPIHVTPWATHLYSYELLDQPGTYTVAYAPQYHPFRALLFANMIEMTLPHLSGYFLMFCENPYAEDRRFQELAARHDSQIRQYDATAPIRRGLLDTIAAAQREIRDGEDPDAAFSRSLRSIRSAGPRPPRAGKTTEA